MSGEVVKGPPASSGYAADEDVGHGRSPDGCVQHCSHSGLN